MWKATRNANDHVKAQKSGLAQQSAASANTHPSCRIQLLEGPGQDDQCLDALAKRVGTAAIVPDVQLAINPPWAEFAKLAKPLIRDADGLPEMDSLGKSYTLQWLLRWHVHAWHQSIKTKTHNTPGKVLCKALEILGHASQGVSGSKFLH